MMADPMKRRIANAVPALLAAGLLGGCAAFQLSRGPEATSGPLRELMEAMFGYESATAARLIVALEFAFAAAVLAIRGRVAAICVAALVGFVALAGVSAAIRQGGLLPPAIALGAAVFVVLVAARIAPPQAAPGLRRGLSPGWRTVVGVAAGTVAANLTAAVDFPAQAPVSDAEAKARAMSIDLDLKPYIGKPITESPIGTYLPRLTERIGTQSAFIVFYNPNCDACHSLFESYFSNPRPELVFAVEIPPAEGAVVLHDGHLGEIQCPQCEFDMLAPGPLWLVAPPMTVKVEGGVITCVADRFGGDCLNPQ